jgi:hypothetical protein
MLASGLAGDSVIVLIAWHLGEASGAALSKARSMTTSTNALPAVRTALSHLIDYAGLFPPAKLAVRPALDEFRAACAGPAAWMLGRFIVQTTRLDELRDAAAGERFALSAIVDAGSDSRTWFAAAQRLADKLAVARRSDAALDIACLEVPLPALASRRETYDAAIGQFAALAERYGLRDLPIYVEVPRDARFLEHLAGTMAALARHRLGAKIRCGGVTPEAFPSVAEVAAFVGAARVEGVPFKATAGLHHPLRHVDAATGFHMHGFLNVLAASVFAGKSGADELEQVVGLEDAAAVRFSDAGLQWGKRTASIEEIAAAREHGFVAYGSCSFSEPVEDLISMQLLAMAS